MKIFDHLLVKILCIGFLGLLMLIPLTMIQSQIRDRETAMQTSVEEVSASWAGSQILSGPRISTTESSVVRDENGKAEIVDNTAPLYPDHLAYKVQLDTKDLHRSIYDIKVYNATVRIEGDFLMTEALRKAQKAEIEFAMPDLRGIEGDAQIELGGKTYRFAASDKTLPQPRPELKYDSDLATGKILSQRIPVDSLLSGGETIPFRMTLQIKGTESLFIQPVGHVTDVEMTSNCTTPSFMGDFLPSDRNVTDTGFTARWSVSEINRGAPESSRLGVKLLPPVTQYQQVNRSLKYGILVILLVFLAGLLVELVTRKKINLIQYLVIGLSLVLFYALLLAFSEFLSFGLSYLIAAGMTVLALTGYYFGIFRQKLAWVLAATVALAYLLNYVLLQMENFALLTGTLVLFLLLCGVMFLTKDLGKAGEN